ncbi:MAG: hypothetical protein ABL866_17225, partial [Devosia sp.]
PKGAVQEGAVPPRLIAVMHLEDVARSHVNLKPRHGDPLDVYLRNAALFTASLRAQGSDLLVLTDAPEILAERARASRHDPAILPAIERFAFKLDVPPKIRFRGAHFKLELIEAIGSGTFGPETGIVDVDCVAIGPLPENSLAEDEIVAFAVNWGEAGWNRVGPDIARLIGRVPEQRVWYGGEFLYGRAEAFRRLGERFKAIWPVYAADPKSFQYVGQEMVLTALLHGTEGVRVLDSREAGYLTRWWSHRTQGPQRPFSEAKAAAILHMPGDKPFLARYEPGRFLQTRFLARYERYLRGRILLSQLSNLTSWVNRGGVKSVPRLR